MDLHLQGHKGTRAPLELLEAAQLSLVAHTTETLEQVAVSSEDGEAWLAFNLHPLGPPIVFEVSAEGVVTVKGETSIIGPGYDAHIRAALREMARDLGIELVAAGPAMTSEARALAFLEREVRRARGATGPRQIGAFGRHRYPGVALATMLGPRDDAWLAAAARDPEAARDVFPWWSEGAGPAMQLGRALASIWHEVRFRPLLSEAEEELAESILEDLRAAYRDAPELSYPAEAWAEVSSLLGGHLPPPPAVQARPLAEAPEGVRGPIGYRRGEVEREVGAGFSLLLPGELAEEDHEDGVWAGDLARSVHVAGIYVDDDAPTEALFAEASRPEGEPIALAPRTRDLEMRAAIRDVEDERILTAVAAKAGRLCLLTAIERGPKSGFVERVAASMALEPI